MDLPDYSTLPWKEFDELWKIQAEREEVLINGTQQTKPVIGAATPINMRSSPQEVEIRVGALLLWQELEQCGVSVTNHDLLSYVHSDLEKHGIQATEAYLQIGQARLRKSPTFLTSVFGFKRKARPVFNCSEFDTVTRTDEHIVFRGKCYANE